jgi:hypothetical protein
LGGKNLPKTNVGWMMCEHENFLIVVGFSMDGAMVGARGGLIFVFIIAYHMSNACFVKNGNSLKEMIK